MRADIYQSILIIFLALAAVLGGVFLYREIYPEYRIFQKDYIALEEFRSSYTGEPPAPFKIGVKQIVIPREDKGPETIDRCISCHVALTFPHFSPTKIAYDSRGNVMVDDHGTPIKVPNENYIWLKLDEEIASLKDLKVNQRLRKEGKVSIVNSRLNRAEELSSLKTANLEDRTVAVDRVLAMHPLIGKETRPFEYHPMETYGCVSCHNGNGRGLVVDKAHGPVFDGEYEQAFEGERPSFTESDSRNDPKFSRAFNHKPGHQLLFQTTPIFVGGLIEAKCVQCHQPNSISEPQKVSSISSSIDALTQTYQRGEKLYISQACYACHRISTFSRGGVGPELTHIGKAYPWYIKESIVWPQADLKSSTMPNMKLDHEELEDLVTFLFAQTGDSKGIASMQYQIDVKKWEEGRKVMWEQPISPDKVHDLRNSMLIFATQGCASCHRLKGFESDVGYRVELQGDSVDFDKKYREHEWFTSLFPEMILGSQIVSVLNKKSAEIDEHIFSNVRKGSILEEIEIKNPGILESFYANFKYASRAKNGEYQDLADAEKDPEKKQKILGKLAEWKARVHRILLMFIQEYGLGRLIGPRPNWSGVYRSDTWLMNHFHNPSGEVPKSLMPTFPFDDSKFYALTYMLDTLGKRNRNALRALWDHRGFNPEEAFQIHCSQCHGEYGHGNGPVSEWIYPIPKNLTNATFMRNLTKEHAIQSITHGVKGTPMPPWGEVPKDKYEGDQIPILSSNQIAQLVEWLYFTLPGGEVIEGSKDVPKWHYDPEDVLKEIHREGDHLSPNPSNKEINQLNEESSVSPFTVFDLKPPLVAGDKKSYFIKQKYYTDENLREGEHLFDINCAICHGKEADGTGLRAESMVEAKPRMLTNLNWLRTRDDLRLLQSIKYGVPGTAMTPWGDLTSALQRMQLVMYIRSLTAQQNLRERLMESLQDAFGPSEIAIENARTLEYAKYDKLVEKIHQIQFQREKFYEEPNEKGALQEYQKEIELNKPLKDLQKIDHLFLELKKEIELERSLYENLGFSLLLKNFSDEQFALYLNLVAMNQDRYQFEKNKLTMHRTVAEKNLELFTHRLTDQFDKKIAGLSIQKSISEGKLPSEKIEGSIEQISNELNGYIQLKAKLISDLAKAKQFRENQYKLFNELKSSVEKNKE